MLPEAARRAVRPGYDTYVEPYLSCGTAFFELAPAAPNRIACVADADAAVWLAAQKDPEALLAEVQSCEARMVTARTLVDFLVRELRAWRRKPTPGRELFLRRHARVWGAQPTWFGVGRVLNATAFLRAAAVLAETEVLCASPLDLDDTSEILAEGTLVYLDMPVLAHWYAGPEWMAADAITVLRAAARWAQNGAQVILRHPALPVMREILADVAPSAKISESAGELVAVLDELQ